MLDLLFLKALRSLLRLYRVIVLCDCYIRKRSVCLIPPLFLLIVTFADVLAGRCVKRHKKDRDHYNCNVKG